LPLSQSWAAKIAKTMQNKKVLLVTVGWRRLGKWFCLKFGRPKLMVYQYHLPHEQVHHFVVNPSVSTVPN
jgi:hypothetical protein